MSLNAFRMTDDGSLDTVYMRTCAIYRLLKSKRIGEAGAKELAARPIRRAYKRNPNHLDATIAIWKREVMKDMLP